MDKTSSEVRLTKFVTTLNLRTATASEAAQEVRNALSESKVLKLVPEWHLANPKKFYEDLMALVGRPRAIGEDFRAGGKYTGERWLEIRYDDDIPDMAAYRHSKNAQPLHTDESYIEDFCDIMLFYCVNRAERGGETTFVDGVDLVSHLCNQDPGLLHELTTERITYGKGGRTRTEKVIDLTDPAIPRFNYNYYCLNPDASEHHKSINQRFFDYLQTYINTSYFVRPVGLNPAEAVLWWDHYVLHGRTAFKATRTNDRFIWKTGINWK